MLCYYNVLVTKNGGKNSRSPEYHWVASSMIDAFHPTTFFQLGVYDGPISNLWVSNYRNPRSSLLRGGGATLSYFFWPLLLD